jgi:DNA-directed RNA polymerase specialized sigma24 family protein
VRRCWVLRVGQGFDEEEIAVLMKIPVETVRRYLDQARHWLARATGGVGRNDGDGK